MVDCYYHRLAALRRLNSVHDGERVPRQKSGNKRRNSWSNCLPRGNSHTGLVFSFQSIGNVMSLSNHIHHWYKSSIWQKNRKGVE